MHSTSLPVFIDPILIANSDESLAGYLSFKGMERFLDAIVNPIGEINIELKGGTDQKGFKFLKSHIQAQVELRCQRCMQNFIYAIDNYTTLSPVLNEEEEKLLPPEYEPLQADDKILLRTIIEDELLLSLPIIPLHDIAQCPVKLELKSFERNLADNPFAKLKELKKKRD